MNKSFLSLFRTMEVFLNSKISGAHIILEETREKFTRSTLHFLGLHVVPVFSVCVYLLNRQTRTSKLCMHAGDKLLWEIKRRKIRAMKSAPFLHRNATEECQKWWKESLCVCFFYFFILKALTVSFAEHEYRDIFHRRSYWSTKRSRLMYNSSSRLQLWLFWRIRIVVCFTSRSYDRLMSCHHRCVKLSYMEWKDNERYSDVIVEFNILTCYWIKID